MKVKQIDGDILEQNANIICHQVNCMGVMGAGLARQIRNRFPVVFSEYEKLCDDFAENRKQLLGNAQLVDIGNERSMSRYGNYDDFHYDYEYGVCNLFGQYYYGTDSVKTNNNALRYSIINLCYLISNTFTIDSDLPITIAIPYGMGCGLAGGDWKEIEPLIIDAFTEGEQRYRLNIELLIVKR